MSRADAAMELSCPGCAANVTVADRFCEECGQELGARRVALPQSDPNAVPMCEGCGGNRYDADGYCHGCGQLRAEPDRAEADLGAVYIATDRGIAHARNEDSVAAAVVDGAGGQPAATVIVVSDGVSSSEDPQAASGAAVRAGVDACLTALAESRSAEEAVMAGLVAASQAVRDIGRADGHAPSCTYISAIVQGYGTGAVDITVANVGDSRAYWLRAEPIGDGAKEGRPVVNRQIVNGPAVGGAATGRAGARGGFAGGAVAGGPVARGAVAGGAVARGASMEKIAGGPIVNRPPVGTPGTGSAAADPTVEGPIVNRVVVGGPAIADPAAHGVGNPSSRRLSSDDSWAQALVDAGAMDEDAAMRDPRAHALLRWLGADSEPTPWSDSCVQTLRTTGPGTLLLCSDGLWNYVSDPVRLAQMIAGAPRSHAARGLVDFALRSGGSDNITVALAPIGQAAPVAQSVDAGEAQ